MVDTQITVLEIQVVILMHGGVVLFRGTGADAMRYVEADRARADDYYLSDSTGVQYAVLDASGEVTNSRELTAAEYSGWVNWVNPDTGEQMGRPREAGSDRQGSPRFAEMVITAPKSLSIAAALHPEVSEALDVAQQNALGEIQRWLAQHSVTRVGPRGKQEVVPVEHVQVVGITHRTSRAGDPHRHIHMQVGTRVWAAGKWRALDTGAMFKHQGAIRALGTAVITADPQLATVLDQHGLALDPVTGEVAELAPFNHVMSKRGSQVRKNLDRLEAEWQAAHPGESIGPVVSARLRAFAWAYERPAKKPTTMREEAAWLSELREAGYDPEHLARRPVQAPVASDDLSVQAIASRALDRCAAASSAWTRHDVQEHATRIITEYGVRATPEEVRELVQVATRLAFEDCFSILPDDAPKPEHVAHLTSLRVVQAETELRDLITNRTPEQEHDYPDVAQVAERLGQQLDGGQLDAAAAVASTDPLVIVEGAAGAGKTTMLATAIAAAHEHGRQTRVVAPTKRAAEVAHQELDVPAESVAALVHSHGFRWDTDGVWTRLAIGDADPVTGATYSGPPQSAQLQRDERIVVDEAGMLDQDTALALFTVAAETGATVALVGDRAQLPAVGRGGVLDIAAQIRGRTFDMAEVHRFTDPDYAELSVQMRDRRDPGQVFDQLQQHGLVHLHADEEALREHIAAHRQDGETITVASNDDAAELNEHIRAERIGRGLVDKITTTTGRDGLDIGAGDLIQTRKNETTLGVANRQQWIVQRVDADGSIWVRDAHDQRKREQSRHLPAGYVSEHAHLSYAATAYGVQGVTAHASHTILTEGMGGAAVYVGMTRGRDENALHVVAENMAKARQQFIDATERDRADRGLTDATDRAAETVRGLVDDGPVKLVNDTIAALVTRADQADGRAVRWQQVATSLDALRAQEAAERESARTAAQEASKQVERARADVAAQIDAEARAALSDWRDAERQEQHARNQVSTTGWLGKPQARAEHENAQARERATHERLSSMWGDPPRLGEPADAWVQRVTAPRIDADPRVVEAERAHRAARAAFTIAPEQAQTARLAAYARVFGTEAVLHNQHSYLSANPARQAAAAAQSAKQSRAEADQLRSLTPDAAVERIKQARADQAAQDAQRVEREHARLQEFGQEHRSSGPRRDGGLGR